MTNLRTFLALVLTVACTTAQAQGPRNRFQREAFTTETPMVHDPVMAKDGDTYYLYATGMGIQQMTSKDRKTWTVLPQPVMTVMPAWTTDSVPGFGSHVWAPDVIQWHGRWWLAYSCSTFGKNGSAIGLLSSRSLRSNMWKDEGCIVTSHDWKKGADGKQTGDNWNAIDPNFVIDDNDQPWLVWGSFWDGIQLARLDSTMHLASKPVTIARRHRPGDPNAAENPTSRFAGRNAIEAPFIFKHGGYYYLFVSWDYCCRGAKSNYRVAVGRSKNVSGPYVDRKGTDMANGGGELFLEGDKKEWEAAGHSAAYTFDGEDIFICHGYSATHNGAAMLIQRPIAWTADGWPELKAEEAAQTKAAVDIPREISVTENIAYRTDVGPNTVLDLAQPRFGAQRNRPAILIIHGGGWSAGSKNDAVYRALMIDYAMKGYVVCNMNYRLVQETPPPACIEDVQAAIHWMKDHARELGIDPKRIGTYGHSAGGHLSLMAGLTADIACAAGGAPPTEIGRAGEWAEHKDWWPIGYIGKSETPFLVLQGGEDPIVRPELTEDWVVKMQRAGTAVDYVKVHGQHGVAFDQQLEFTRPALDAFFARHLKHDDPSVSFEQMKVVEYGGSGPHKAVAVREQSLPDFVVYRPMNLDAAMTVGRRSPFATGEVKKEKLPVLVFCNGGCMDTSIGYENMLSDIASYGYVVVAVGELQMMARHENDRHTPSSMVQKALDWVCQQAADPASIYYNKVDTEKMAAAGHSCGGAQVLANAGDARLKTYIILNAGMGQMTMADASAKSLKNLHGPILYLVGGTTDVAWANAQMDYKAIKRVPVVLADNTKSGHGGTYEQPNGGDNSRMVRAWLDWQLKGKTEPRALFIDSDLTGYDGFTIMQKNFK